jgi:hypothetical protein
MVVAFAAALQRVDEKKRRHATLFGSDAFLMRD